MRGFYNTQNYIKTRAGKVRWEITGTVASQGKRVLKAREGTWDREKGIIVRWGLGV